MTIIFSNHLIEIQYKSTLRIKNFGYLCILQSNVFSLRYWFYDLLSFALNDFLFLFDNLVNQYGTCLLEKYNYQQGGRGHWTVNYAGTQSFITTLSYIRWLKTLVTYGILFLIKGKAIFCIEFISIYRPLSYPLRSLNYETIRTIIIIVREGENIGLKIILVLVKHVL